MNFNKVTIGGRLTRDPELRYSNNNVAICSIRIATNHRYKDANGKWVEKPVYVDATIFGKRGEAFDEHHRQGDKVFVHGRLDYSEWDDKNTGAKRNKVSIVVEEFEFVKDNSPRQDGDPGGSYKDPYNGRSTEESRRETGEDNYDPPF